VSSTSAASPTPEVINPPSSASPTPEIIRLERVSKSFPSRGGEIVALDGVDLSIGRGEVFGIIGHSGAGKSTLVRLVNGLEEVTSGRVVVDGVEISALDARALAKQREQIGMIFQQFNLLRSRTVFGNVAFPLWVAGWPKARREERVWEMLDFVGLTQRAWAYPEQLSGGQKQRVGIARALVGGPQVLLADEATSALDPETTGDVLELLRRTNRELGVTIVVITHEMDVVRAIADRVAVLDGGRVVEQGTTVDVFANPAAPTTRAFLRTVLRTRPAPDQLAALRSRGAGRLFTVTVRAGVDVGAVLSDAVAEDGVRFRLHFGEIDILQGQEYGAVTVELLGDDAAVDRVLTRLGEHTTVEEEAA